MDQLTPDGWIVALVLVLWLASFATWIGLIARLSRRSAILDYEPRSPVPWGAPAALISVLFVAITVTSGITESASQEPVEKVNPPEAIRDLFGFIVFQGLLIGGVLFIVAVLSRTNGRDLGLPSSVGQLFRDVRLGVVAWLAAIAPIHGLQILLLTLLGLQDDPPSNPLIKMVTDGEPNLTLLVLASAAAVIVAPLTEEIMFRLLLQGWLEKLEDTRLGWRRPSSSSDVLSLGVASDVSEMADSSLFATNAPMEAQTEFVPLVPIAPPRIGASRLPHGWMPILISSLLFALAHYGYGPDPVPIFFLALILGYVYQRTHRIVPCMVAHALFNGLAMVILWQMIFSDAK